MANSLPKLPTIKLKLSLANATASTTSTSTPPPPPPPPPPPFTPDTTASTTPKSAKGTKPDSGSRLRATSTSTTNDNPIAANHLQTREELSDGNNEEQDSSFPAPSSAPLFNTNSLDTALTFPPSPFTSTPKSTPRYKKKQSTTNRKKTLAGSSRPSALPSHLTPRSSVSFTSTPTQHDLPTWTSTPLQNGGDDSDPLSLQASPVDLNGEETSAVGTPLGSNGGMDTPASGGSRTRGNAERKWMRIKRPFRELANKIMIELRRKDEYGLFLEPGLSPLSTLQFKMRWKLSLTSIPVNTDEYPDYLAKIGGQDKMMDLGTMQTKIDSNEYDGFDQFEADIRALVAAAHAFNPIGSVPYNAATRILTVSLKHIDRSRPLVRTPSPSPTRFRTESTPLSEAPTPGPTSNTNNYQRRFTTQRVLDQATSTIPEAMLTFPPNSLQALGVGWNLNGGKRVWAKKFVRGREKFSGKWREWAPDGSRDLAEMDEADQVLEEEWGSKSGESWRKAVVDWKGLRKDGNWWEVDGIGGPNGQAPISGTPRTKVEPLRKRELGIFEWGVYPEIEAELALLTHQANNPAPFPSSSSSSNPSQKIKPPLPILDHLEVLSNHLRPIRARSKNGREEVLPPDFPVQSFENIYQMKRKGPDAGDWLREIVFGDPSGEAYVRSVEKFVAGAMKVANRIEEGNGNADGSGVIIKEEESKNGGGGQQSNETLRLDQWVRENYHGGLLGNDPDENIVQLVMSHLHAPIQPTDTISTSNITDKSMYDPTSPVSVQTHAKTIYELSNLTTLNSAANPLDLIPLLKKVDDFAYPGILVTGAERDKGKIDLLAESGGVLNLVGGWIKEEANRQEMKRKKDLTWDENRKGKASGKRDREDEDNVDVIMANGESGNASKKIKIEAEEAVALEVKSNGVNGVNDPVDNIASEQSKNESSKSTIDPTLSTTVATTSSPITSIAVSKTESETDTETEALRKIRLEILALAKFYPLASLKKMDKADAERLLPPHVRKLMSRDPGVSTGHTTTTVPTTTTMTNRPSTVKPSHPK